MEIVVKNWDICCFADCFLKEGTTYTKLGWNTGGCKNFSLFFSGCHTVCLFHLSAVCWVNFQSLCKCGGLISPPYSAPSFARLVAELLGRGWVGSGSGGVSGPPYCPLCRKSFTRAWSLQRHMADTHFYVPQSFECDVCGRSYRSRNSLVSHKSQYHGGASGSRASSKEAISSSDSDNALLKGERHDRGESEWISWS